jgi:AcrR family transcriptional regulator
MATSVQSIAGPRPMRADARRNYEQLLRVARDVFTAHGPDASLEEIARRAGVGVGTLYRHFPTRRDLYEAVIRDHAEALAVLADELRDSPSPGEALATWLRAELVHSAKFGGLGAAVMNSLTDEETTLSEACRSMHASAAAMLTRAQEAGVVRSDVDASSLLRLVNAIAVANEHVADGAAKADHLLSIVLDGLRPQGVRR